MLLSNTFLWQELQLGKPLSVWLGFEHSSSFLLSTLGYTLFTWIQTALDLLQFYVLNVLQNGAPLALESSYLLWQGDFLVSWPFCIFVDWVSIHLTWLNLFGCSGLVDDSEWEYDFNLLIMELNSWDYKWVKINDCLVLSPPQNGHHTKYYYPVILLMKWMGNDSINFWGEYLREGFRTWTTNVCH